MIGKWLLAILTIFLVAVLASSFTRVQGTSLHVVINEIEQNPPGTDAGNEWVELFNPTSSDVAIGGWKMSTTAGSTVTVTVPPGTTLPANGYWVYTHSSQWLDNEGESVILQDASLNEIDRTPLLSDTANDVNAWSRFPNGVDTDSTADWRFQPATKGGENPIPELQTWAVLATLAATAAILCLFRLKRNEIRQLAGF